MPAPTIHGKFYGTGKRKNAIARVFMSKGKGVYTINGRTDAEYFPRKTSHMVIRQPLAAIEKPESFDVVVNVSGGGLAAQAEAVRHGISRALLNIDATDRPTLKKAGFLTRDSRKKERKKPGQPGARKKFQFSKR